MVTHFSARLVHLANTCKNKRKHIDESNDAKDTPGNINNGNQLSPKQGKSATKLQGNYFYAHTHTGDAAARKKRRSQKDIFKDEVQYAAATIQSALRDAGQLHGLQSRRERALPMAKVDMDLARVMTSKEYDDAEAIEVNEQAKNHREDIKEDTTDGRVKQQQQQSPNDDDDVQRMHMVSGLVRSTRHYYNHAYSPPGCNPPTVSSLPSSRQEETIRTLLRCGYGNNNKDDKLLLSGEYNNSEGLSSWTPSSMCSDDINDGNCNGNYKMMKRRTSSRDIDNDNPSDGQSSLDRGSASSTSSSASESSFSMSSMTSLSCFDGPLLTVG